MPTLESISYIRLRKRRSYTNLHESKIMKINWKSMSFFCISLK